MKINFTNEELYVIERDADLASSIAGKNIFKITELFIVLNCSENKNYELLKQLIKLLDEHYISSKIYKSIRNKCEKERIEGLKTK